MNLVEQLRQQRETETGNIIKCVQTDSMDELALIQKILETAYSRADDKLNEEWDDDLQAELIELEKLITDLAAYRAAEDGPGRMRAAVWIFRAITLEQIKNAVELCRRPMTKAQLEEIIVAITSVKDGHDILMNRVTPPDMIDIQLWEKLETLLSDLAKGKAKFEAEGRE